ncbi:MAG TPA: polyhydroxybutyrate depolymerase [Rheinheimera sp.]|nr:polyhydroxybutyrate depolymerase [Rheinheimera sp.]
MRLTLLSLLVALPVAANDTLPTLNLTNGTTLSGISSGAYMASQYHLAFSNDVQGVGLIAGGPWGCAQADLSTALAHCMAKPDAKPDLAKADATLQAAAKAGKLASLDHVKNQPVYVLHGTLDQTVGTVVSDALVKQYQTLGAKVTYDNTRPFAHHFPTLSTGTACDKSESPFLGNCNFDAAGALLKTLLPNLKAKANAASGQLLTLDQQALAGESASSLGDTAYLYVPSQCAAGQACQLHIAFHGCKQYADAIGDTFARGTGLNDYADSNNLVILYPQTEKSMMSPFNPNGCWDWWGYTGADYATKDGAQVKAVRALEQALRHSSH